MSLLASLRPRSGSTSKTKWKKVDTIKNTMNALYCISWWCFVTSSVFNILLIVVQRFLKNKWNILTSIFLPCILDSYITGLGGAFNRKDATAWEIGCSEKRERGKCLFAHGSKCLWMEASMILKVCAHFLSCTCWDSQSKLFRL